MAFATRPNRVQLHLCHQAVAEVLGEEAARAIIEAAGFGDLPEWLPATPRDLAALSTELQPFVDLYRSLLAWTDRPTALRIVRRAILDSGAVCHAWGVASDTSTGEAVLDLTKPPAPGFAASPEELASGFAAAMRFFSCEGRLLAYDPKCVHFIVTACNWCRAMEQAGTPELIEFFCETDERFMDGHPTHRLHLTTTIGRGGSHCDFQFVPHGGEEA